jgi:hypothetical protein
MKSSAYKFKTLKRRLKKVAVALVRRLHKTQMCLLKMFPIAQNHDITSVFDKSNLL